MDRFARERDRLAMVEHQLDRLLQAQYELAMSAFKFDEANGLQRQIAALEGERRILAAGLPSPSPALEPPTGVVPVLRRPRRPPWTRRNR